MKSKALLHLLIAGLIFFSISIFFQVSLLVSADESSCSPLDQDSSGSCTNGRSSSSKGWSDEVGDKFQQFLQDKVFGQKGINEASDKGFLTLLGVDRGKESRTKQGQEEFVGVNSILNALSKLTGGQVKGASVDTEENPFRALMDRIVDMATPDDKDEESKGSDGDEFASLIAKVKHLHDEDNAVVGLDFLRTIQSALEKAIAQLQNTFGKILDDVDASIAISVIYFLAHEDARKNPSWKRQQHRFCETVSKSMIMQLHDALYLSQLSYVNTVDEFKRGLTKFQNNEWEIAYGTTDSLPHLPAHFLLIHKKLTPLSRPAVQSILPWESKKDSELTVTLVVRGTKDLSDALADALLEPVAYRGGYAHGGILANGKNLADMYLPKLKALLEHSSREKIRLYLVGHSLGAGAAAIAAMEFHEHDWITVESLGFGCPSLLSHELSEATKEYITTVVADSDIIPRMSGASMANLLLDLLEFDWTAPALDDLDFTFDRARSLFPFANLLPDKETILEWAKTQIERGIKPKFSKENRERVSNQLIPPGVCLHFYRDGIGYSGVYTPCSFFESIDISRTLVDDHLVVPGYHRAFVTIMRDWENNFNYDFPHDIVSIKA